MNVFCSGWVLLVVIATISANNVCLLTLVAGLLVASNHCLPAVECRHNCCAQSDSDWWWLKWTWHNFRIIPLCTHFVAVPAPCFQKPQFVQITICPSDTVTNQCDSTPYSSAYLPNQLIYVSSWCWQFVIILNLAWIPADDSCSSSLHWRLVHGGHLHIHRLLATIDGLSFPCLLLSVQKWNSVWLNNLRTLWQCLSIPLVVNWFQKHCLIRRPYWQTFPLKTGHANHVLCMAVSGAADR